MGVGVGLGRLAVVLDNILILMYFYLIFILVMLLPKLSLETVTGPSLFFFFLLSLPNQCPLLTFFSRGEPADIWSAGVCLFFLIFGGLPFDSENDREVFFSC